MSEASIAGISAWLDPTEIDWLFLGARSDVPTITDKDTKRIGVDVG